MEMKQFMLWTRIFKVSIYNGISKFSASLTAAGTQSKTNFWKGNSSFKKKLNYMPEYLSIFSTYILYHQRSCRA